MSTPTPLPEPSMETGIIEDATGNLIGKVSNADPKLFAHIPAESVNMTVSDHPVPTPKPTKSHKWIDWWRKQRQSGTQTTFSKNGITHNEQHESLTEILKACNTSDVQHNALISDMIKWIAIRLFKYLTVLAITAMIIAIAPNMPAIMAEFMSLALKYGLI